MRLRLKDQSKAKVIAAIFIVLILLILTVYLKWKKEPITCANCNIVLISFDTLRAENVGIYGYSRNTTPTIDEFGERGFIFTNAISVTSWTLPSHMSWFTGTYPSQHKVLNKFVIKENGDEEITNLENVAPDMITLAEVLRENGYKTGGFTGGAGVHHQFGFDKGFEVYTDDKDFAGFEESTPKALEWIKEHKDEKLFVFLHGYDIHGQYVPEEGYDYRFIDFEYKGNLTGSKEEQKELREEGLARGQLFLTQKDVRFLTGLYDEKVQRADEQFALFIEEYARLGLMDKTIFILTSDHGEELYEHGRIDHGHSLYEELINVPLVITLPGATKSKKIGSQVRSIDLMPTILDLVQARSNTVRDQIEGMSLKGFMESKGKNLDVFPETDYRYSTFQRAVRMSDSWKLILNLETDTKELYNLNNDPRERENIANKETKQINSLEQKLQNHLKEFFNNEPFLF